MRFVIYMCRAEATQRLLGLSISVTALAWPVETKNNCGISFLDVMDDLKNTRVHSSYVDQALFSCVDQSFLILSTIFVYVFVHHSKEFASRSVLYGD